jgi:integrase
VESFQGDYLRSEEVPPYLDGVKKKTPRYYPILRTMTYAGLRVGEAIAAQSLKAGLRHIRVRDLRGIYASLGVSAGAPVYHVSKSLGHSEPATTERHYASIAPGAARELPTILERFVRDATVQNANRVRTEGVQDGTPLSGESVSV